MHVTEETKAHAQEILDFIAHNDEGVWHSQTEWWSGDRRRDTVCGTTMCIAGTSVYLKGGIAGLYGVDSVFVEARLNLGLNTKEASHLFYEMWDDVALDKLRATANGDADKFEHLCDAYPVT